METEIIIIYCLADDYFKGIGHQENPQVRLDDTTIMTTAIVSAICYGGNFALAQRMLSTPYYFGCSLSRSRFSPPPQSIERAPANPHCPVRSALERREYQSDLHS